MSLLMMTHHYKNEGPKLFQTDRLTDRVTETDTNRPSGRGRSTMITSRLPLLILDHPSVCVVCGGVWVYAIVCEDVGCVKVCENGRVVRVCEGVCEDV